jgi:hypothetical protein
MLTVDNIWQLQQTCENLLALKILHDYGLNVSNLRDFGVYSDQEWDAGEDILYGAIKKLFGPWVDEREEDTAYEIQKISVQCPDVQKLHALLDERFLQKHFQPFSHTSCERYPMEMFIKVTGDELRFEFHELMGSCGIELFETLIGLRKKIDQLATLLVAGPKEQKTHGKLYGSIR